MQVAAMSNIAQTWCDWLFPLERDYFYHEGRNTVKTIDVGCFPLDGWMLSITKSLGLILRWLVMFTVTVIRYSASCQCQRMNFIHLRIRIVIAVDLILVFLF